MSVKSRQSDQGEANAFRVLFDAHYGYVWNTLRRLGIAGDDRSDLCQEVFLVAFKNLDRFDTSRPERPWLFGIAYRIARRYRDLARHKREVYVPSEPPATSKSPLESVEAREMQYLVSLAIARIELSRRAVFIMAEIDGHSAPEIAQALDVPLNTVYSRLRLARRDFAAAVDSLKRSGRFS